MYGQKPQMPMNAQPQQQAAPKNHAMGDQEEMYQEGGQGGIEIDGEALQGLLFSRVEQLTPMEMQILDSIITPQTVPVLFKLFPELGILFEQGTQIKQYMAQQQQQPQQAPQQNPLSTDGMAGSQRASSGLTGF